MTFPLRPTERRLEVRPAHERYTPHAGAPIIQTAEPYLTPAVPAPHVAPPAAPERAEPLVDLAAIRELAFFPLRAARRRRRACAWLAAGVVAAAVLAAALTPRTYHAESRILAQKNVVMPALNNPKRAVPLETDGPNRLAVESVMSRDNLVQIVQETNLLAHEDEFRSPLGRVANAVLVRLGRGRTGQERLDAMVELLRKQLWVDAGDQAEGAVTIGVDWRSPRAALAIATTAQDHFLDQRHATEVARIGESISILERYVEGSRVTIDSTLTELGAMPRPRREPDLALDPTLRRSAPTAKSREVAGLQSTLATRRVAIQDLTTSRAGRLATANAELTELRRTYGAAHPDVLAAEENVAALTAPSPQLTALRAEEKSLRDQLAALGAPETPDAPANGAESLIARAAIQRLVRADTLDDPRLTYAQSRLKIATAAYEDLLDRLESARIELETARAAFKYRYSIVTPPQLPKRAVKPNAPVLVVGGVMLAAMLALFAATVLDLASGRVIETWQIRRQLGLPLLGEVPRS